VAVRPLGRIPVDYEDPHGSAPDPNHMFPLMFQSLVTSLSGGGHSPVNEFPPAQAAERFNAQWASASVFDVVDEFAPSHGQTPDRRGSRHTLIQAPKRNPDACRYPRRQPPRLSRARRSIVSRAPQTLSQAKSAARSNPSRVNRSRRAGPR
jgi:hypothetical protein